MTNELLSGPQSRIKILKGIDETTKAIATTAGPQGRNQILCEVMPVPLQNGGVKHQRVFSSTKDGVTVSRSITHPDVQMEAGGIMVKDVCERTVEDSGDGPQPLYAKVLTPIGFVEMGSLKEGDIICGTNQTIQSVIGVYPKGQKKIVRVKFADGRIVECCEDHLWEVVDKNAKGGRGERLVLTTKRIVDTSRISYKRSGNGSHDFYVPVTPVEFYQNSSEMPLDPYLVGLLLGDGSLSGTGSIELCIGDKKAHIIPKIRLPEGITLNTTFVERKNSYRIKFVGCDTSGFYMKDILKQMGLLGVRSNTKFIPKPYLYSSFESRQRLLWGLTDTDGHISNRGLFSTPQLAVN